MNIHTAKKLAKWHKFTIEELNNMMIEALETYPDEHWRKPYKSNPIMDNGYFFNECRKFLNYDNITDKNEICQEIFTVRILQCAGEFSKIQLPKKKKYKPNIIISQKPML